MGVGRNPLSWQLRLPSRRQCPSHGGVKQDVCRRPGASLEASRRKSARSQRAGSKLAVDIKGGVAHFAPVLGAHAGPICGRDEVRGISRPKRRRKSLGGHFVVYFFGCSRVSNDGRGRSYFRARFSESEQRGLLSLTLSPRFGRHKLQGNRRPLCCRWQKPSPPRYAAPPALPVCIGGIASK
jgi:hypothetical protein